MWATLWVTDQYAAAPRGDDGSVTAAATLVYDADCGFCTTLANWRNRYRLRGSTCAIPPR